MRKIIQAATGGPEVLVLQDAPDPFPAAGEVLVAVAAAGINPVDIVVRAGIFPLIPEPPFTIGWDIAGTVLAAGDPMSAAAPSGQSAAAPAGGGAASGASGGGTVAAETSGFVPGTRVFGMPRFPKEAGGYASMIAAPAAELAETPVAWSDAQAAAVPLAGLTAWQSLVVAGKLAAGMDVLVTAAAGGVGHLAVQIAAALGARVAASASPGKHALLAKLGAAETLPHIAPDPAATPRFDLVLDAFGGETTESLLAMTRPGGVIALLRDPSPRAREIAEATGKVLRRIGVRPNGPQLAELARLGAEGRLTPIVARSFPLAEAGAAHVFLQTEKPVGKIVLLP